jgi:queuine tRNA-ribosyltransferase catalytic subunit
MDPHKRIKRALSWSLSFSIDGHHNKARASTITLPHGPIHSPVYMPVGTKAAIKGITFSEMRSMGCQILLSNTYHLGNYPGTSVLDSFSGLHSFEGWAGNILTDSGGFQMVSLLKLATITEAGVEFLSPVDGRPMLLTPEESIRIQNSIGADIMMALDDVANPLSSPQRLEEACHRTTRWIDRCLEAHNPSRKQNLFGIVQGGLDFRLREISISGLVSKELPGYAIGGLCGGEDKERFWRVVKFCTDRLPWDKPRYLMGVGYPVDLVVCACLGVDMFDCVFPTRTARFGTVFTSKGFLKLRREEMKEDLSPIEEGCLCEVMEK